MEKKTDKPKRAYKKSGIPTLNEMVEMELSIPDVSCASPQTVAQLEQWETVLMKKVNRLFDRHSKYRTDNNDTADGLFIFLDKYPELFVQEYGTINRDMLKHALMENIKKNRMLIDKIQEIEKQLNLEMHHEW